MDERRDFYIYVYVDPRDNVPFYVGRGCRGRDKQHLQSSNLCRKTMFYCKLRSLVAASIAPHIRRLRECLTHDEANQWETFFILGIGRRNDPLNSGPLCNLTNGGEGNKGYKATSDTRQKNSNRARGNRSHTGHTHSPEARAKIVAARATQVITDEHRAAISSALQGRVMSPAAREKMRLAATGRRHTEETREKIRQVKLGFRPSAETRARMSASRRGKANTWACRQVQWDGVIYQSVKQAVGSLGISAQTFYRWRKAAGAA